VTLALAVTVWAIGFVSLRNINKRERT